MYHLVGHVNDRWHIPSTQLFQPNSMAVCSCKYCCFAVVEKVQVSVDHVHLFKTNFLNIFFIFLWLPRPDLPRPIKVNLAIPIIFIVLCVILVMLPSIKEPMNLVYGILITLTGVPFYYLAIKWKNKPACLGNSSKGFERFCQLMFNTLFVDGDDKENWIFYCGMSPRNGDNNFCFI